MSCHKMFVESRFQPCFLAFAVEFRFVLFASAVHVFSRFTIVACTQRGDVRWSSSPQAAPAVYSIANSISPATDLVLRIFAWHTFLVGTLVPPERICVHQSLFQGFPCSFDDLDGEGFSATSSHLLLLALHQLLKLRPWCGWDEDARFPKRPQPFVLLSPLIQPSGRLVPALGSVDWSYSIPFCF